MVGARLLAFGNLHQLVQQELIVFLYFKDLFVLQVLMRPDFRSHYLVFEHRVAGVLLHSLNLADLCLFSVLQQSLLVQSVRVQSVQSLSNVFVYVLGVNLESPANEELGRLDGRCIVVVAATTLLGHAEHVTFFRIILVSLVVICDLRIRIDDGGSVLLILVDEEYLLFVLVFLLELNNLVVRRLERVIDKGGFFLDLMQV